MTAGEKNLAPGQVPRSRAVLYMIIAATLWSFSGLLIKLLPWNPLVISGLRSGICALTMFFLGGKKLPKVSKSTFVGGLFITMAMFSFIAANKLTTAANAIVLQYTQPVFIILINAVFYKQRVKKLDLLAVGGVSFGIVLFFFDRLGTGGFLGNLLAIFSGLSNALLFVYCSRTEENSTSALILGHFTTFLLAVPFLFFYPPVLTPASVGALLALGVVQQGVAYLFYAKAVKSCGPLDLSLISVLEPLLSPVWVLLFVGEMPGMFALWGGAVILSVIVGWNLIKSRRYAEN